MRYLFFFLLLSACSTNSVTITLHQIDQCNQLGIMMKMKASINHSGECEIKSDLWDITENFNDIDGAIQMLEFQQALKLKPIEHACYKKCATKISKNLCAKTLQDKETSCLRFCYSAEGLDEYIKTGKTSRRYNEKK